MVAKGGMKTKPRAICDDMDRPLNPYASAVQVSDCVDARALPSRRLLDGRGYDAGWFSEALKDKGIRLCIPDRKQRTMGVKCPPS